jgi:hypothetical protein
LYTTQSGEPVLYVFLYFAKNRKSYFLRIPAAARKATPIAARMVAEFTGDFWVTPAAGAAGIAAEAGACAIACVAAGVAPGATAEDPP